MHLIRIQSPLNALQIYTDCDEQSADGNPERKGPPLAVPFEGSRANTRKQRPLERSNKPANNPPDV